MAAVHPNGTLRQWIVVRPETTGTFAAEAVGLPQASATAATREDAIDRVHEILDGLLASGQLVSIEVQQENPLLQWSGRVDPNDPHEQAYLQALARQRQADMEDTLRELDQACSDSSSTPTT